MTARDWKWLVALLIAGVCTHFNAVLRLEEDIHSMREDIIERMTRIETRLEATAVVVVNRDNEGAAIGPRFTEETSGTEADTTRLVPVAEFDSVTTVVDSL
jgi:hypothetical protein